MTYQNKSIIIIIIINGERHLQAKWKILRTEVTNKQLPNKWVLRYEGKRNVGRHGVDGPSNSDFRTDANCPVLVWTEI